MPLPNLVKMGIFIKKFHYKEKPMFGIEPNLDKVFGGMLKPQQQKLVDYQAYRLERDNIRYSIFGRRVENSPSKWLRDCRFWFDRKNMEIVPEMSPYMDVLGAKIFPDTFRYYGIQA
jgi:hypothetical protein